MNSANATAFTSDRWRSVRRFDRRPILTRTNIVVMAEGGVQQTRTGSHGREF